MTMIEKALFNSYDPWPVIERNERAGAVSLFDGIEFDKLDATLLRRARKAFEGPAITATKHSSYTDAAKRTAYEIRDEGTGWRGVVMLDDAGDPWMVFCGDHSEFHSKGRKVFFKQSNAANYMPSDMDYLIRDREDARKRIETSEITIARNMLDAIRRSLDDEQTPTPTHLSLPSGTPDDTLSATITVHKDHDVETNTIDRFVELTIDCPAHGAQDNSDFHMLRDMLIRCFNAVCQPRDPDQPAETTMDTYTDSDGQRRTRMAAFMLLEQHDIERIHDERFLSDPRQFYEMVSDNAPEPTLHLVPQDILTDAYVNGDLIRSLCNTWFVPSRDENANLPYCPDCQAIMAFKELLADMQ